MVETTLDIRFYADDAACVIVDSNAPDELEQQAELVSFGHFAARIIGRLGHNGALPLIHSLTSLEEASTEYLLRFVESEGPTLEDIGDTRLRVLPPESSLPSNQAFRVLARFLDTRRGPRMSFTMRLRGLPAPGRGDAYHALASVHVLFYALLKRRTPDRDYLRRLAGVAGLMGRLAASGQIRSNNEFDVSLAAADVAWRRGADLDRTPGEGAELLCPACGNRGSIAHGRAFDFMLWPSDRAGIRRCNRCGTGLWLRAGRRPRRIAPDLWRTMERIRAELSVRLEAELPPAKIGAEQREDGDLLEDLKRAFVENGWPFSEVLGADVLVSELSGPLGTWKFYAQVVEEQELILLYSVCPLRVPDERRLEVSHFLTRANYGLAAGNFELDFDDGEIRCKTVLHVHGDEIDRAAIKKLVRANGLAMETYLPGIGAVITGTPALPALERRTTG